MLKYFLLVGGIVAIIFSITGLYINLAPKVGPVGNGPNYAKIWLTSIAGFIIGVGAIFNSIRLIKKR